MRAFILSCLLLLYSCNTVMDTYNNVNQKKVFVNIESYRDETAKKGFQKDKLIILSDAEFQDLAQDIVKDHLSIFYGIVYKSQLISANELNIKSCSGQVTSLYHKISQEGANFQEYDISKIRSLQFDPNKKTVIMLYSYKLGKYANTKIKPVIDELENDLDFDYYIVSLDNFDILER